MVATEAKRTKQHNPRYLGPILYTIYYISYTIYYVL